MRVIVEKSDVLGWNKSLSSLISNLLSFLLILVIFIRFNLKIHGKYWNIFSGMIGVEWYQALFLVMNLLGWIKSVPHKSYRLYDLLNITDRKLDSHILRSIITCVTIFVGKRPFHYIIVDRISPALIDLHNTPDTSARVLNLG